MQIGNSTPSARVIGGAEKKGEHCLGINWESLPSLSFASFNYNYVGKSIKQSECFFSRFPICHKMREKKQIGRRGKFLVQVRVFFPRLNLRAVGMCHGRNAGMLR